MQTIGERLKQWRKENKLTTLEISQKTGVSAGGLSEYENDKKLIGSKVLLALYNEYRIDIAWILTGERKEDVKLSKNDKELLEHFQKLPEREQIKFIGRIEEAAAQHQNEESSTSKTG